MKPKHETFDHTYNPIPIKRLKSETVNTIYDWSQVFCQNLFEPCKIFAVIAVQRSATHMIGRSPGVKKLEQARWGDFWMTLGPDPHSMEAEVEEQEEQGPDSIETIWASLHQDKVKKCAVETCNSCSSQNSSQICFH